MKVSNRDAPPAAMTNDLPAHGARPLRLTLLFCALAAAAWLLPAIPQPPAYHLFADRSTCLGVAHCADTLSNLLFVLAGTAGLAFLASRAGERTFIDRRERLPYRVFFGAVALVGIASGYYHLAPDNARLAWDRAAVAAALMAWFAAIVCERADIAWGRRLLPALLAAGLGSVAYWAWSESVGRGDLRAYGLMQFAPFVFVPLLLRLYPPRYTSDRDIFAVLGLYLAALICDLLDKPVAAATGFVSGHTLKHLLAAGAAFLIVASLGRRRPL